MTTIHFDDLIGTTASLTHTVTPEQSAKAWGNGLDVLATPVLLWLSEIAAMKVIEDRINDPAMSVGLAHDSAHLAPTPTGETVTVTATLTAVDKRRLTFDVEARDNHAAVLRGTHTRAVVDRHSFTEKLAART
ncbi:thioesterase family protein [Streptomyces sp. NPDC058294]|uniref:thioesterase family protein n=1 Tax=Streptomyces sp. NPDC058294 TaxID=3346430 RepID=UPI0036DFD7D4